MPYSYDRYRTTLEVFRQAKINEVLISPANTTFQFALRDTRARGILSDLPEISHRTAFSDDDESGDEDYAPGNSHNKKAKQPLKRKAADAAEGEREPKSAKQEKTHTPMLCKEDRLKDKDAFITLGLTSPTGMALLGTLVAQHQNDVTQTGLAISASIEDETYLERLDKEAQELDNEGGRALRSRKVPDFDFNKCQKCHRHMEKCKCHEALIVQDIDRGRQASIPPMIPKDKDLELQPYTPSRKGKERALSPIPPGLSTPASSTPGGPSSSKKPASQIKSLQPKFKPAIPGKRVWMEGDRVFVIDQTLTPDQATDTRILCDGCEDDTFQMNTRWGHPINFKYIPKSGAKSDGPCRFCTNFLYGIYGEIERRVLVRRDRDGQYTELLQETRCLPTKMCVSCALGRRKIIACVGHRWTAVRQDFSRERYNDQLNQKVPLDKDSGRPVHDTCSVCAEPSAFRCCTEQQTNLVGKPIPTPNTIGCGLKLCVGCRHMLQRFPDGRLHLRGIKSILEEQGRLGQIRADAEFICEGKALEKAYRHDR